MKEKQITGRLFVSIHGVDIPWETLASGIKEEISAELTDRAMSAIGYRRKEKPLEGEAPGTLPTDGAQ